GGLAEPRADLEAAVERSRAELARDARRRDDRRVTRERRLVAGGKRELEPGRHGERFGARRAESGAEQAKTRAGASIAQGPVRDRSRAPRRQRRDAETRSVGGDRQRDADV